MGSGASKEESGLSVDKKQQLKQGFDAIRGESKVVSYSMVHAMVELGGSPMLARLLPLFGKTTYGEMTLQEYQSMMAIMAVSKGPVAHYKLAHRALDDDNDGVLGAPDLFFFYKWLLGGAYSDVQLSEVVQQVLAAAGPEAEASQSLSLPQLAALVPEGDLDHKFTVDM